MLVLIVERRPTREHLVEYGAQTPPVGFQRVAFVRSYFWCQVGDASAKSVRDCLWLHSQLGQPEISQLNVTLRVEQDVLRLQVSVQNLILVQVADGLHQLSGIDLCSLLVKLFLFSQVSEHFASVHEIDGQVQLGIGLEGVVQFDNVRTLGMLQDLALGVDLLEHVKLDKHVLAHYLERIGFLVVDLPHQTYLPEGAPAYDLQVLEVINADPRVRRQQVLDNDLRELPLALLIHVLFGLHFLSVQPAHLTHLILFLILVSLQTLVFEHLLVVVIVEFEGLLHVLRNLAIRQRFDVGIALAYAKR